MKFNKNHLLSLIDVSASRAKNFVEGFNAVVDSLDMETCLDYMNEKKAELIRRGNELFGEFNELLKQVKDSLVDFSVTVPYDKANGESIEYRVVDDKLEIKVAFENETTSRDNCTRVRIPKNCDLEHIELSVNESKGTATITIPKIAYSTNPSTEAENLGDAHHNDAPIPPIDEEALVNEPMEEGPTEDRMEEAPMPMEEEPIHEPTAATPTASSELEEKLNANVEKCSAMLNRDARGRFMRRKPNA